MLIGCSVSLANAQTNLIITIHSNGSVEGTDLIQRKGDIYTLTGDIFGTIYVRKDGITIDGAGYTIHGNGDRSTDGAGYGINLKSGIAYGTNNSYGNIVVKNVRFRDCSILACCADGNSFINNIFDGGTIVAILSRNGDSGNVIKYNVFGNISCGVMVDYCSSLDVITENDFINSGIFVGLYEVPVVDRNYWSDYKTMYPDAKEIDNTGIWNTPYLYDLTGRTYDQCFFDNNPLVNSVGGFEISGVKDVPKSFLAALIIGFIAGTAIISIRLLYYFKKHKQSRNNILTHQP
jgi:hypothetical protein